MDASICDTLATSDTATGGRGDERKLTMMTMTMTITMRTVTLETGTHRAVADEALRDRLRQSTNPQTWQFLSCPRSLRLSFVQF